MRKQINTIYIIAAFLTCTFLTSGFIAILPVLSQQFSSIKYEKADAEKSDTESQKETEKSGKEYYHLTPTNAITADIKLIDLSKPFNYSDKCLQLFVRTILTPPPEDYNSI